MMPPAPQVTEQARLIVMAIAYLSLMVGLVALLVAARAYVTYTPPAPQTCVAGPGQECVVQTANGPYTLYYVQWNRSIGVASPTPGRTP